MKIPKLKGFVTAEEGLIKLKEIAGNNELYCIRCEKEKPIDRFRFELGYRGRPLYYIKRACVDCQTAANLKRYHQKYKYDEKQIEKDRARGRLYHKNNRDKVLKRLRAVQKTAEYKEYQKQYYIKNQKKINARHLKNGKKYTEALTDHYVRQQLGFKKSDNPSNELLEAHRAYLRLRRELIGWQAFVGNPRKEEAEQLKQWKERILKLSEDAHIKAGIERQSRLKEKRKHDRNYKFAEGLSDSYIRQLLQVKKKNNIPQEILEIKRLQVQFLRSIQNIRNDTLINKQ